MGTIDAESHPARHRADNEESGRFGTIAGLVGLVVLAAGGFAAWSNAGGAASSPAGLQVTRCGSEHVVIAASRDIAPPLSAALIDAGCSNVEVEAVEPIEVSRTLVSGVDVPDYWVPDSTLWVARTHAVAKAVPEVLVASLASTPVVLASGNDDAPDTWAAALTDPGMVMGDPLVSTVAAVPLLLGTADASPGQSALMIAPLAQEQFDTEVRALDEQHRVDAVEAANSGITATTEQQLLAWGSDLFPVVPAPGSLMLDYPLVVTAAPERAAQIGDVSTRLAQFTHDPDLADELALASFRPANGAAIEGGVGKVPSVPMPTANALLAPLAAWSTLAVPIRSLAVVDVSGSMDFPASHGTRMDVTVSALQTGLSLFQDSSAVGLWAFSEKLDGPRDYRELLPIRRLGEPAGGVSQRDALAGEISGLTRLTTGGTGLYDTVLAAYRDLQSHYDPKAVNSILLFTDGANDDPGSISENELVSQLSRLANSERPVQIIAIGITKDSDEAALSRIAAATGGFAMIAERPEDMIAVFQKAMEARF